MKVAVVDYGMGNLHSVAKALAVAADERLSIEITQNPAVIEQADKVVFPGVGAMRDCMIGLNEKGLDQALNTVYTNGKPILAICIGWIHLFLQVPIGRHNPRQVPPLPQRRQMPVMRRSKGHSRGASQQHGRSSLGLHHQRLARHLVHQ